MALFKKKNQAPPDVGEEEDEEAPEENEEDFPEEPEPTTSKKSSKKNSSDSGGGQANNIELQRIKAQLESLNSLVKGYSERFSNLSERIGEVRSMAMNNEKQISQATKESSKAVDIVKEVKPEKLGEKYQKAEMKVSSVEEKVNAQKKYMDTIMKEVKDMRRKMGVFVGTDALLNLNKEVKDDLFEIQKLGSKVKGHADKSEQIFIELKRILADNQKDLQKIRTLDSGFSEMKKEIQKLKLDKNEVIDKRTFNKFKSSAESKIIDLEKYLSEMENVKKNNQRLKKMIEKIVAIEKRNEEDLKELSVAVGDENTEGVKDFENRLNSLLNVIDSLAGEIREVKKKVNSIKKESVSKSVQTKEVPVKKQPSEDKINIGKVEPSKTKKVPEFKHIDVHPDIKENLVSSGEDKKTKQKTDSNKHREKNEFDINEIEGELDKLDKQARKTDSLFKKLHRKLSGNEEEKTNDYDIDEDDESFLDSLTTEKEKHSKRKSKKQKKKSSKKTKKSSGKKSNKASSGKSPSKLSKSKKKSAKKKSSVNRKKTSKKKSSK